MTKKREVLNEYTDAYRDLELTATAIGILESVRGRSARKCIDVLQKSQQQHLKRIDAAAAQLGAPYPGR